MSDYIWVVYSLLAAISAAAVVTLTKAGLKNVDPNVGFAIQAVMILIVSWSVTFWQGQTKMLAEIDGKAWAFLLAAGILTAASSLFNFRALSLGNASQVSPFSNISLIFAIIFAVVFLKEKITWQIIVGGILMLAGAFFIASSNSAESGR